jgi:hypothetical protein
MQFTRSLIEKSIDLTIETCVRYGIHLPPFAYWTVEFWDAHPESVNEIRVCMLGWDVTDFGSSDFTHIGRNLEWKTRTIQENDPHHRPVFCHPGSPIVGRVADFRWAKIGDFYGSSNYPAWYPYNVHQWDDYKDRRSERNITRYNENWYFLQMLTDILRCICGRGKPVWGAEFQGGPIGSEMFPGRIPSKEDIRLWMYAGLAAGMTGISFWNHRPEIFWGECNGFGILDQTGETTERAEEISLIGRVLNEEAELFAHGEVPQPQVAILFNSDLFNFCQATWQNAINHLQFTIIGHYYRLWRMGVFVDFLTE